MKTVLVFICTSLFASMLNVAAPGAAEMPVTGSNNLVEKAAEAVPVDDPLLLNVHVKRRPPVSILPGAVVTLTEPNETTPLYTGTADSNGDVTFDEVIPGTYHYKITAAGCKTLDTVLVLSVNTERSDTLTIN